MGSKSSSTTQKSEFITTTNENISDVDGPVATDGGQLTINTLDGGSIREAFNLGGDVLDFGYQGLDRILDFGDEVIADQADQLTNTLSSINAANATGAVLTSENRQETIRQIAKFAAMAAALVGIVWVFRRATR